MTGFEDTLIRFVMRGNRRVLTDQLLAEMPTLRYFLEAFPGSFERDEVLMGWVFVEPERGGWADLMLNGNPDLPPDALPGLRPCP